MGEIRYADPQPGRQEWRCLHHQLSIPERQARLVAGDGGEEHLGRFLAIRQQSIESNPGQERRFAAPLPSLYVGRAESAIGAVVPTEQ